MRTVPGTAMSDEPYTLTETQIDALNSLPPGIYHVCSQCRRFNPMSTTITLIDGEMTCEACNKGVVVH